MRAGCAVPVCSPKSFLNLLFFCSYCVFFVFLYLPKTFLLWSYLRLSSKGSVPFLSINLHIKEIVLCSASVFGVNAKKTTILIFLSFLLCLVASTHARHSSFIPRAAPSLTRTSFFCSFFFFLILILLCSHLRFSASLFQFLQNIFSF